MINVVNKRTHAPAVNDVYCGRPSVLGNPYPVSHEVNRYTAVEHYRHWLWKHIENDSDDINAALDHIEAVEQEHGAVNLVCYCAPLACHCDVIKRCIEWRKQNRKALSAVVKVLGGEL